jgi:hypothetical protein
MGPLYADRSTCTISISQGAFIDSILTRFNLTDAAPVTTPLAPGTHLSADDRPTSKDEMDMATRSYREMLRAVTWLALVTRPDIAFATSSLARRGYCVTSKGGVSLSEERDADWGSHQDTSSRSEMGWKSKKQSFVDRGGVYGALPSAERVSVVGGFLGRPWCFSTGIDGG